MDIPKTFQSKLKKNMYSSVLFSSIPDTYVEKYDKEKYNDVSRILDKRASS